MRVDLNSRKPFRLGVLVSLWLLSSCIFQNEDADQKSIMDGTWSYVGIERNGVLDDIGTGLDLGMIIRGDEVTVFYSGSECTLLATSLTSNIDSMELWFGNSNDTIKTSQDDSTFGIYARIDHIPQESICPESFYSYNLNINHLSPDSGSLVDLSDTLRLEMSYSLDEKVTNPELYYISGKVKASDGVKGVFVIDDLLIEDTVSVNIPIDDPLVLSSIDNGLLVFTFSLMLETNGSVHMPMLITSDYIYHYD